MVKKIANSDKSTVSGKELQKKRLKLKTLHKSVNESRATLKRLPPEELPPASSSNAARQVRSRLNITFPVNWQDLHLNKHPLDRNKEPEQD